jgi:hypothetical protein
VLDGTGTVTVGATTSARGRSTSERTVAVEGPGAYRLIEHEHHTAGVLALEIGIGVECLATCFTPGVA